MCYCNENDRSSVHEPTSQNACHDRTSPVPCKKRKLSDQVSCPNTSQNPEQGSSDDIMDEADYYNVNSRDQSFESDISDVHDAPIQSQNTASDPCTSSHGLNVTQTRQPNAGTSKADVQLPDKSPEDFNIEKESGCDMMDDNDYVNANSHNQSFKSHIDAIHDTPIQSQHYDNIELENDVSSCNGLTKSQENQSNMCATNEDVPLSMNIQSEECQDILEPGGNESILHASQSNNEDKSNDEGKNTDKVKNSSTDDDKMTDEEKEKEYVYMLQNDPVRKWQWTEEIHSVMTNNHPKLNYSADVNKTFKSTKKSSKDCSDPNEEIVMAPGEGQIPENVLFNKNWDINSFPHFHPDGKYGLHFNRQVALSNLQYFNQRILNVDTRFSKLSTYVYAAVMYLEQMQMQRNINLSTHKGIMNTNNSGESAIGLDDCFAVFDKIKGTPKFWQSKKRELLAKVKNFGPFNLFFTLSCPEKRWPSNVACILRREFEEISIEYRNKFTTEDDIDENEPPYSITVDGLPWEEYVEKHGMDFNAQKEFSENILTLTRNFDHNVKMFIKHVVKGNNNPMHVKHYNYRIEFQSRGAPHAHGVIWMDLDAVKRDSKNKMIIDPETNRPIPVFPGVKDILAKIKNSQECITDEEANVLTDFIDQFITVSNDDPDTKQLVSEVNTHHHTQSCHKHGQRNCRFCFPKLPTSKTIISVPFKFIEKEGVELDMEQKYEIFKEQQHILQEIKDLLDDDDMIRELEGLPVDIQIEELCQQVNVSVEYYYEALKYSHNKYSVHYKRRVEERYVNNYNKEWLMNWNGNMDIQICLDYFAVVSYITDYVTKDETGVCEVLKQTASANSSKKNKERLQEMATVYATHRLMGNSEAIYKLIPSLHLTDSDTTYMFLSTGFPQNRSRFYKKVSSDEEKFYPEGALVKVGGCDSTFFAKPDPVSKYKRRPIHLENMCLMQFTKMYEAVSSVGPKVQFDEGIGYKIKTKKVKRDDAMNCSHEEDSESEHELGIDGDYIEYIDALTNAEREELKYRTDYYKDLHKIMITTDVDNKLSIDQYIDLLLPKYIELSNPSPGEPKYMRLRKFMKAVDTYGYRRDEERHEFLFSELLLYRPFRDENELYPESDIYPDNAVKCATLYKECEITMDDDGEDGWVLVNIMYKVQKVKSIVMEHLEDVEQGRAKANRIINERSGEFLDPTLEQENNDGDNEGIKDDESRPEFLGPRTVEKEKRSSEKFLPKVKLLKKPELCVRTQLLDKEQMLVLEKVIEFVKGVKKWKTNKNLNRYPTAPHVIVHGGGGVGKSLVIDLCMQWVDTISRCSGDDSDEPYVLPCSYTGKAAVNIGGDTLHGLFHLKFGNQWMPLGDKECSKLIKKFRNLLFILIDEVSMVSADILYYLDRRLRELKDDQSKEFGGVGVLLVGDLGQLRPVLGTQVFSVPNEKQYHDQYKKVPLWQSCEVVNLVQNHRQAEDKEFGDMLNEIRFGRLTDANVAMLLERVREISDPDIPINALFCVSNNYEIQRVHDSRIQSLSDDVEIHESNARHFCADVRRFRPNINSRLGWVAQTRYMNTLRLWKGARVMLIYNINKSDKLANGQMGEVLGFHYVNNVLLYVIVEFDDPMCGRYRRQEAEFEHIISQYPSNQRPTPIKLHDREYRFIRHNSDVKATVTQFPLTLAFSATAHKLQGQTIYKPKPLVVDLRQIREGGQAYVMLSRVQEINQLYILEALPIKKIYACKESLKEMYRLENIAITYKEHPNSYVFAFLNTMSLRGHYHDIPKCRHLIMSDVLSLSETWLLENEGAENYQIHPFGKPYLSSKSFGKGIAVYSRKEDPGFDVKDGELYTLGKIAYEDYDVVSVYASTGCNQDHLLRDILAVSAADRVTIVGGDFNICSLSENGCRLVIGLNENGFRLIPTKPTHIKGRAIDHCYIREPNGQPMINIACTLVPIYWSDHDALMVEVPKDLNGVLDHENNDDDDEWDNNSVSSFSSMELFEDDNDNLPPLDDAESLPSEHDLDIQYDFSLDEDLDYERLSKSNILTISDDESNDDDTMCVDISNEIIHLEDDSDDQSSNQKVFERENCYVTMAESDFHNVSGDGHCIIHAFRCSLRHQNISMSKNLLSYRRVLNDILKEVEDHLEEYIEFLTDDDEHGDQRIIHEMCEYLYTKNYRTDFVDQIPLILANAYSINFGILTQIGNSDIFSVVWIRCRQKTDKCVLIRKCDDHYQAVFPNINRLPLT